MPELDDKIAKLPRWAQEHIKLLNYQLASKTARVTELSNSFLDGDGKGLQKTDIKIEGWISDPDVPLPSNSQIEFILTPHNRVTVAIRESEFVPSKRVLKIMSNGCDPLLLKMHASNSFEIVFDTDRKL